MKKFAFVAIILIAGCASTDARTGDTDSRIAQLKQKRQALAESEKQCVVEATKLSHDKTAGIAVTSEASLESQAEKINDARDREISQCHAWADHENAEIAEQERNEYESEAQQERNRASFIALLATSRPR
jgi:membrane-bound lytic murein transglycosylase